MPCSIHETCKSRVGTLEVMTGHTLKVVCVIGIHLANIMVAIAVV